MPNIYKDILLGVTVGDALGVPVEFMSREQLAQNPVRDMTGFGTYNLPPGSFSDDSSMTFCLAESLATGFSTETMAAHFISWYYSNYWTPHGHVFDSGIATQQAIARLQQEYSPELADEADVMSNGNGSLMRILPLLSIHKDLPAGERFLLTQKVSSLTHRHIRSVIACYYYLEFACLLVEGNAKHNIQVILKTEVPDLLRNIGIPPEEIRVFDLLLKGDISALPAHEISSSGYVVHTLEAAVWCLLTTDTYTDEVLKAVNLVEDTDTTGAVAGGLAGLLYGYENIHPHRIDQLARKDDIIELALRWEKFSSR